MHLGIYFTKQRTRKDGDNQELRYQMTQSHWSFKVYLLNSNHDDVTAIRIETIHCWNS